MAVKPQARPSARERLLAAANELFYTEGVHTVGIDRVIDQAGVAKASLYNTFGSKEELVHAYLEGRHASVAARITKAVARYDNPRDRLLGVFDAQGELFAEPAFRGWVRGLLTDLARDAGVPDPARLARQLHLIYDGASLSARMDHDQAASA